MQLWEAWRRKLNAMLLKTMAITMLYNFPLTPSNVTLIQGLDLPATADCTRQQVCSTNTLWENITNVHWSFLIKLFTSYTTILLPVVMVYI